MTADTFALAGGRTLPRLLFVTDRSALEAKLGPDARWMIDAIGNAGHALLDVPNASNDRTATAVTVRASLNQHDDVAGVVVVGGYDVMPSFIIDVVPADLEHLVNRRGDKEDLFIVWSDEPYGDADGDGGAELPVSRVPDGNGAWFLGTVLSAAPSTSTVDRAGARNVARPWADDVWSVLPGSGTLLVSRPAEWNNPAHVLDGRLVYLMLHGNFRDTTTFKGEAPPQGYPIAETLANVPQESGGTVLAGCCWGALISDCIAAQSQPGTSPGQRDPGSSIAMAFLAAGSLAFVGCTGLHYSPPDAPFRYHGRPMHESFWRFLLSGHAPAQALHAARAEFAAALPHGQSSPQRIAIEYKLLREFTCLGLGW